MNLLRAPSELHPRGKTVSLAIGMFDGVHLGHQQVIRQALSDASQQEGSSVVITFDRHPNTVVAPDRVPPLIYSVSQRLRAIEHLGVDAVLMLHFDETLSRKTGEEFIRELVDGFGKLYSVCVGSTFHFGRARSGNVALLHSLGKELRFIVHGLSAVSLDDERVSSTRIREAIRAGNLDLAGQMLGREYSLAGPVTKGDGIGRKMGIPTANLNVTGLVVPPTGVYAVHCSIDGLPQQRGVVNIGVRPTLQNPAPALRVEAHLLDFDADLYGKELELSFVQRLRDEQKFPSLDSLRTAIAGDISQARELFHKSNV
jgi:riboflavin kinase / FMN adenylyltransferase